MLVGIRVSKLDQNDNHLVRYSHSKNVWHRSRNRAEKCAPPPGAGYKIINSSAFIFSNFLNVKGEEFPTQNSK